MKWLYTLSLSFLVFLVTWVCASAYIEKTLMYSLPVCMFYALLMGLAASSIVFFLIKKFPKILGALKAPEPIETEDAKFICCKCGGETTQERLFKKVKKGTLGKRDVLYCPMCLENYNKYAFIKSTFLFGATGVTFVAIDKSFAPGWILLNLSLAIALSHVSLLPHESGHAFFAKLLGMRVFRISVGIGNVLFKAHVFNTLVEFRLFPTFGYVVALNTSIRWFRLKRCIMVFGGIFANIMMIYALYRMAPQGFSIADITDSLSPIAIIIWLNVLSILVSLWPIKFISELGTTYSDGLNFVKTLFMKKEEINEFIARYYCLEGMYWKDRGDYEASKKWYEACLEEYPDNRSCKNDLGVLCMKTGNFDRALKLFHDLYLESHENRYMELLIKNNLAYTYAVTGDKGHFHLADTLSEEVYENHSWNPTFKNTRGLALVQAGKTDEGLALLYEILDTKQSKVEKSVIMIHIAIGESHNGNRNKAMDYYHKAKDLDPQCCILPFVERELAIRTQPI